MNKEVFSAESAGSFFFLPCVISQALSPWKFNEKNHLAALLPPLPSPCPGLCRLLLEEISGTRAELKSGFYALCQVMGLLCMNAPLSNEQCLFEIIYILFMSIFIFKLIYVTSPGTR